MDNYLAEIRAFGLNYAPAGWALCDGSLLDVSKNTALFSLLGTTYGGDGLAKFALPDLRGRVVVGPGQGPNLSNYYQGQPGGTPVVALNKQQMPSHEHDLRYALSGSQASPAGELPTKASGAQLYNTVQQPATVLDPINALSFTGGGQPHNNLMPYLPLTFCIALQGIYPPRGRALPGVVLAVPVPGAELETLELDESGALPPHPSHVVMGPTDDED